MPQHFERTIEAYRALDDETIGRIAQAHGKTPAQVMLRWHLQEGRSVITKSTNAQGIAQNIDVFDFALAEERSSPTSTP